MVAIPSDHVGVGEPRGVPLRARLPLARDEVADVLGQIGHALVAAHSVGVAHGALSLDRVFVTYGDSEPLVRVFDFGAVLDEYRTVRDDIAGLVTLATEIVGASPPNGFGAWRARCANEPRTIAECVNELRALFPLPGDLAPGRETQRGTARRFERPFVRADRRGVRAKVFDRVTARTFVALFLAASVVVFALVARLLLPEAPTAPVSTTLGYNVATATTPARDEEPYVSSRTTEDLLAGDRASCPDRFLSNPLLAASQRSYRCVRAVLYQRVLDSGEAKLSFDQRKALKLACAALSDLGCVMRVASH